MSPFFAGIKGLMHGSRAAHPLGQDPMAEFRMRRILVSDRCAPMHVLDPIILCELPVIQKIIRDETWLEGERRGCPVSSRDTVVRENVCRIVIEVGQRLREASALRALSGYRLPSIPALLG